MQTRRYNWVVEAIIIVVAAYGCVPVVPAPAPGATRPAVRPTFTAIPTFTPVPATATALRPTAAPTATEQVALGDLFVTVTADNVNLRTRPGTTFPVSRLLAKGTRLQLLGHAPGNEWLLVQTNGKVQGWVLTWLVQGARDGGLTPEVQPGDVQIVRGKVVDAAGVPISGIGFAVTQGPGPQAPGTIANTDSAGQFYAFLPATASGTWLVTYISVACTSNTMDARCNCIGHCGKLDPEARSITLPSQEILQFAWR